MKTTTIAAIVFSGTLMLSSCGESSNDHESEEQTAITPEQTKEAQKAVDAIQESVNKIEEVESEVDKAIEDLDL